jgi:hypothetical protein
VENPIDETTTVAAMLRREPQVFGAAPFSMAMGPERIRGTFQADSPRGSGRIEQTDHRYESVSKARMKRGRQLRRPAGVAEPALAIHLGAIRPFLLTSSGLQALLMFGVCARTQSTQKSTEVEA